MKLTRKSGLQQPHAALRHRVAELERQVAMLTPTLIALTERVTALEAANIDPQATKLSTQVGEEIPISGKEQ